MPRSLFGWDLPPGTANHPYAPWNIEEPPENCPMCGKPNTDDDGNPIFDDPGFCSQACLDRYEEELMEHRIRDYEEEQ
jgi:hypothetical protein